MTSSAISPFDARAATWETPPRVELARAVVAAIGRNVPLDPSLSVADYGAGTGLVSLGLAPQVGSVTAIDNSAGMLSQLREKLGGAGVANVTTLRHDLESE